VDSFDKGMAIVFIALCVFGAVAVSASKWHDVEIKRIEQQQKCGKQQEASNVRR
jgi:hypothetical protein